MAVEVAAEVYECDVAWRKCLEQKEKQGKQENIVDEAHFAAGPTGSIFWMLTWATGL